jgi:nucleoside-diphosphate-sugar epimerase
MNPKNPVHALITSGAGFIGFDLAEALLERGWQKRKEEVSRDRPATSWWKPGVAV